jgi:hypothetical protein
VKLRRFEAGLRLNEETTKPRVAHCRPAMPFGSEKMTNQRAAAGPATTDGIFSSLPASRSHAGYPAALRTNRNWRPRSS